MKKMFMRIRLSSMNENGKRDIDEVEEPKHTL
jgi:hypothetical protein